MSVALERRARTFNMEAHVKDLRLQLNEQLRCLDTRVDTQTSVVSELQEYFRRRAEVELEYSRSLDKLNKSLSQRHKDLKQKRDQMHLFSSYSCWQLLMQQTRHESRERALLADIYSSIVNGKLARVAEDLQRIYRRCRTICAESHEELLKVLHELQVSTKTYNMYYTQFSNAENKLQYVENQKGKLEQNIAKEKLEKSRKFRLVEKEILKRRNKYQDTRLKALQSRNDFLLSLEAANAAVHRYFADDLSDLMDCMDVGFHTGVARALLSATAGQECTAAGQRAAADTLHSAVSALDSRLDKQKFIEANNAPFMLPKKFEFMPHRGDTVSRYEVDPEIKEETQLRYEALCRRITALRTSTEEIWKTMETAERSLVEMVATDEVDVRALYRPGAPPRPTDAQTAKLRADHMETEQFYMTKFAGYIGEMNLSARLQAKYELLRSGLGQHSVQLHRLSRSVVERPRRKRIGRAPASGQPRLFGGSLEEYLELSGQEIPLIIRSSVRVINLFGLHHQGIFRVSGSQVEINNFRESFERGEDPLADVTDASDINSVAGVLKLYLRELREPFFPTLYFEQFMEIAQLRSSDEMTARVREVVTSLPRPVYIVMRYLFAFLNHLSEFSDENMMEPYNLAICFGPTLLPIPEDKDQVQYQSLVNELMKHIILHHEDIFPRDGGTVYEKYISKAMDETDDIGEAPSDVASTVDDPELEMPSEDDSVVKERDISMQIFGKSEQLEAVAQFDFTARSPRELSFRCGDVLTLYRQVSSDWWRGSFRGQDGLIPDKYIMLKIRDEDRSSTSDTSSQPRASVSSEAPHTPAHTPSPSTCSTASTPAPAPEPPDPADDTPAQPPPEGCTGGGAGGRAARAGSVPSVEPLQPLPLSSSVSLPPGGGGCRRRPALLHSVSSGDASQSHQRTAVSAAGGTEGRPFSGIAETLDAVSASGSSLCTDDSEVAGSEASVAESPSPVDTSVTSGHASGGGSTAEVSAAASTPSARSETSDLGADDPETSAGRLDDAMRQIELVTETLRAAELSDQASAAAEGGALKPLPMPAAAAEPITAAVCAVSWQARRPPPPSVGESTSSVRSRRALWETLAAGGPGSAGSSSTSSPRERSLSRESTDSSESPTPPPAALRAPKHTPDLVMDLPPESQLPRGSPPGAATTAAETFARQNQCTLKRGQASPGAARATPSTGPTDGAGDELEPAAGAAAAAGAEAAAPAAGVVQPQRPRARVKPQVAQKPKLSPEMLKKLTDA